MTTTVIIEQLLCVYEMHGLKIVLHMWTNP